MACKWLPLIALTLSSTLYCSAEQSSHVTDHATSVSHSTEVSTASTTGKPQTTQASASQSAKASSVTQSSSISVLTQAPSGSTLQTGQINLPSGGLATACSSSVIPLQTTFWVQGPQVDLNGNDWFNGKGDMHWKFYTTTPGIVFGQPSIPQFEDPGVPEVPFNVSKRTKPNEFEVVMGALGGNTMSFEVLQTNGTDVPDDIYSDEAKFGDLANKDGDFMDKVVYELGVYGYGVCDFPVEANSTCKSGRVDLSSYNWEAYKVDDFLKGWTAGKGNSYGSGGLMQAFQDDFGIHTTGCSTIMNQCQAMESCSDQHPDNVNATAVFLAFNAMANLETFFHDLWQNVGTAQVDLINSIDSVVSNFYPDQTARLQDDTRAQGNSLSSTLALSSTSLGMASMGLMMIPEVGPALGGIVGLISGALGIAGIEHKDKPIQPQPVKEAPPLPPQFADAASLSDNLKSTITSLQTTLQDWQESILLNGNNFTDILAGGTFVNQSAIGFTTPAQQAATDWLEMYLSVKLINYAWWAQNVFIAVMPYGTIDGEQVDQDYCNQRFTAPMAQPNTLYACNTSDIFKGTNVGNGQGGMARLAWYSPSNVWENVTCSDNQPFTVLWEEPAGWQSGPNFKIPGGQYTFSAMDVITGSLKSLVTGGHGYDYMNEQMTAASNAAKIEDAMTTLKGVSGVKPGDAGMFNLPVVFIDTWEQWPEQQLWGGWSGFSMAMDSPVQNWTTVDPAQNSQKTTLVNTTNLPPQFNTWANKAPGDCSHPT